VVAGNRIKAKALVAEMVRKKQAVDGIKLSPKKGGEAAEG